MLPLTIAKANQPPTVQHAGAITEIADWRTFRLQGEQFLTTATRGLAKRGKGKIVFTPVIIYNITAMAIEKTIMAYLMKNGDLADNHTMADLIAALERHLGRLPFDLAGKLLYLDSFQEICDPDTYRSHDPSWEQAELIVSIGREIHGFLHPLLYDETVC